MCVCDILGTLEAVWGKKRLREKEILREREKGGGGDGGREGERERESFWNLETSAYTHTHTHTHTRIYLEEYLYLINVATRYGSP